LSIGLANTQNVSVQENGLVQNLLDNALNNHIKLGPGHYYGDLVVRSPFTTLEGSGEETVIHGGILVSARGCTVRDLCVRSKTTGYGVRLNTPGAGTGRTKLERLFVGASYEGAGDGGVGHGLDLDGSILTEVNQCIFAFNTGCGVRGITSDLNWATTTTRFNSCTFNGNGTYGAQFTGPGMGLIQFNGGNMEGNTVGEFQADGCTHIHLNQVDFETSKTISNVIQIGTSNPIVINDCGFINVNGSGSALRATRAFLIQSCSAVRVTGCRTTGYAAGSIGQADFNCQNVIFANNSLGDTGTYLEVHRH